MKFFLIYFLGITLCISALKANDFVVGIVILPKVNVQSFPKSGELYKVSSYLKGKIVTLKGCNKYDWCKLKDANLYIPKYALGIMKLDNSPFKNVKIFNEKEPKPLTTKVLLAQKKRSSTCIELKQISLSENELFSIDTQNELLLKYKNNKCLNGTKIKKILQEITKYYSKNGYVTTRPFLLPQNLNDGKLDINISVGKVEKIIDSELNRSTSNISFAFINQKGKVLNLRDLETSLESMNRVPSSKATFKIAPSKQRGNSIIKVKTQRIKAPFDATLGINGKRNFKDENPSLLATLSFYNPLSINDILRITVNGSRIQEEYQSSKGNEINYSFSIGSYLLEFIKSYSTYRQGVDGINNVYLSNGHTHGYKTKLSKIIFRNQKNKFQTALSLNHKDAKNYFENVKIETSSYKTSQLQFDLIHTLLQPWGQIGTTLSIHQGGDWLGARGDEYTFAQRDYVSDAKLEFIKYALHINSTYNFTKGYSLQSNLSYQYSKDNLYSSDKFSLGSTTSVRGYSGNYFGNIGWYMNNTITKSIDMSINETFFKNISFYMGLDYGDVPCKDDNIGNCGDLYGSALGIKSDGKHFNTDFLVVRPLKSIDSSYDKKNYYSWSLTMKF